MKMANVVLCCAFLTTLVSSAAMADQTSSPQNNLTTSSASDTRQNDLDRLSAPVHSANDLNQYLASHSKSPLDSLSPDAKKRFLASLYFTDKGLASFSYEELQAELNPTQIYQILSLFGVQSSIHAIPGLPITSSTDKLIMKASPNVMCAPSIAADTSLIHTSNSKPISNEDCDYGGYRCASRGTCMQQIETICTHNC